MLSTERQLPLFFERRVTLVSYRFVFYQDSTEHHRNLKYSDIRNLPGDSHHSRNQISQHGSKLPRSMPSIPRLLGIYSSTRRHPNNQTHLTLVTERLDVAFELHFSLLSPLISIVSLSHEDNEDFLQAPVECPPETSSTTSLLSSFVAHLRPLDLTLVPLPQSPNSLLCTSPLSW